MAPAARRGVGDVACIPTFESPVLSASSRPRRGRLARSERAHTETLQHSLTLSASLTLQTSLPPPPPPSPSHETEALASQRAELHQAQLLNPKVLSQKNSLRDHNSSATSNYVSMCIRLFICVRHQRCVIYDLECSLKSDLRELEFG